MPAEGMVHALEIIRALLKPAGLLIDLRPRGDPAEFRGYRDGQQQILGTIDETDGFIEYRQAAWASEQAIDRGWFNLEASGVYDFILHVDTLDELTAHLEVNWGDAVIPSEVWANAAAMQAQRITLTDSIHFGVLRRQ